MSIDLEEMKIGDKECLVHVYRATKGKYLKPIRLADAGLNWVNANDKPTTPPLKCRCDHPEHWQFGRGTRNGQKLWYAFEEMFYQKYYMTKKEVMQAVKQYDMASLEMRGRIICANCAQCIQKRH